MAKLISDILEILPGDIISLTKQKKIDAIVNAANPTLMGSKQPGVDKSIHDAVDSLQKTPGEDFNYIIRRELDAGNEYPVNAIRCPRGKAVVTSAGSFCKYVIHVVGIPYDGTPRTKKNGQFSRLQFCSSSCTDKLSSCYTDIVEIIKKHPDIETVIVPVISAGNYHFPFNLAVKIALVSIANALVDWRNQDEEYFNESSIQKIYLCINTPEDKSPSAEYEQAKDIYNKYHQIFEENKRTVYQFSTISQINQLLEIIKYDWKRGESFKFCVNSKNQYKIC